ncbi:hypothetical protein GNIT_1196 [Glaciecola nitratireducens FR1064]|uniref:Uncharacterized protein n=1 Tax=Glaciecola nitratireducens (strain JCM 12485 / KCTC 12276 / FR1064) TaxID=1085623 RepID=G4QKC4_GLANF|nr:hypothetical protein GNIT_1196 [Glaciecola nitratireducens FR1064]
MDCSNNDFLAIGVMDICSKKDEKKSHKQMLCDFYHFSLQR